MSDIVLARIAAWEAAGFIDAMTAERLRAAEADEPADAGAAIAGAAAAPGARPTGVSSFFGPAVTLVEAFSYLGAAFVLSAWFALIGRLSGQAAGATRDWLLVAGLAVPAAVFFVIGLVLHDRSARLSRAAGVAFVVSVGFVASGVAINAEIVADGAVTVVAGTVAGLLAAMAYRWYHPSVLTEVALLATITGVVQAVLGLLAERLDPAGGVFGGTFGAFGVRGAVLSAAAWLGCAVVIGLIALLESRSRSAAAGRRAGLARFWAGLVAIAGVATALMRSEYNGAGFQRVIEPWIADVIVLAVSAVLVERAFRRESAAYVLAAALGVVVALTDFNATYVAPTSGIEIALLVEGLLLIAIALGAERIRRRVRDSPPSEPPGEPGEPGGDVGPPPSPREADSSPDGQAEAVAG
jgi:hypothetical protein